jgi:hypothetical protein
MSTHGQSLTISVIAAAFAGVVLDAARAITASGRSASPYVLPARPGAAAPTRGIS